MKNIKNKLLLFVSIFSFLLGLIIISEAFLFGLLLFVIAFSLVPIPRIQAIFQKYNLLGWKKGVFLLALLISCLFFLPTNSLETADKTGEKSQNNIQSLEEGQNSQMEQIEEKEERGDNKEDQSEENTEESDSSQSQEEMVENSLNQENNDNKEDGSILDNGNEESSTSDNSVPQDNQTNVKMVWIPESGTKYHSKASCSGMKNPAQVTLDEAIAMGYTACKRCH